MTEEQQEKSNTEPTTKQNLQKKTSHILKTLLNATGVSQNKTKNIAFSEIDISSLVNQLKEYKKQESMKKGSLPFNGILSSVSDTQKRQWNSLSFYGVSSPVKSTIKKNEIGQLFYDLVIEWHEPSNAVEEEKMNQKIEKKFASSMKTPAFLSSTIDTTQNSQHTAIASSTAPIASAPIQNQKNGPGIGANKQNDEFSGTSIMSTTTANFNNLNQALNLSNAPKAQQTKITEENLKDISLLRKYLGSTKDFFDLFTFLMMRIFVSKKILEDFNLKIQEITNNIDHDTKQDKKALMIEVFSRLIEMEKKKVNNILNLENEGTSKTKNPAKKKCSDDNPAGSSDSFRIFSVLNEYENWICNEFSFVFGISEKFRLLTILRSFVIRIDLLVPFANFIKKAIGEMENYFAFENFTDPATGNVVSKKNENFLKITTNSPNFWSTFSRLWNETANTSNLSIAKIENFLTHNAFSEKSYEFLLYNHVISSFSFRIENIISDFLRLFPQNTPSNTLVIFVDLYQILLNQKLSDSVDGTSNFQLELQTNMSKRIHNAIFLNFYSTIENFMDDIEQLKYEEELKKEIAEILSPEDDDWEKIPRESEMMAKTEKDKKNQSKKSSENVQQIEEKKKERIRFSEICEIFAAGDPEKLKEPGNMAKLEQFEDEILRNFTIESCLSLIEDIKKKMQEYSKFAESFEHCWNMKNLNQSPEQSKNKKYNSKFCGKGTSFRVTFLSMYYCLVKRIFFKWIKIKFLEEYELLFSNGVDRVHTKKLDPSEIEKNRRKLCTMRNTFFAQYHVSDLLVLFEKFETHLHFFLMGDSSTALQPSQCLKNLQFLETIVAIENNYFKTEVDKSNQNSSQSLKTSNDMIARSIFAQKPSDIISAASDGKESFLIDDDFNATKDVKYDLFPAKKLISFFKHFFFLQTSHKFSILVESIMKKDNFLPLISPNKKGEGGEEFFILQSEEHEHDKKPEENAKKADKILNSRGVVDFFSYVHETYGLFRNKCNFFAEVDFLNFGIIVARSSLEFAKKMQEECLSILDDSASSFVADWIAVQRSKKSDKQKKSETKDAEKLQNLEQEFEKFITKLNNIEAIKCELRVILNTIMEDAESKDEVSEDEESESENENENEPEDVAKKHENNDEKSQKEAMLDQHGNFLRGSVNVGDSLHTVVYNIFNPAIDSVVSLSRSLISAAISKPLFTNKIRETLVVIMKLTENDEDDCLITTKQDENKILNRPLETDFINLGRTNDPPSPKAKTIADFSTEESPEIFTLQEKIYKTMKLLLVNQITKKNLQFISGIIYDSLFQQLLGCIFEIFVREVEQIVLPSNISDISLPDFESKNSRLEKRAYSLNSQQKPPNQIFENPAVNNYNNFMHISGSVFQKEVIHKRVISKFKKNLTQSQIVTLKYIFTPLLEYFGGKGKIDLPKVKIFHVCTYLRMVFKLYRTDTNSLIKLYYILFEDKGKNKTKLFAKSFKNTNRKSQKYGLTKRIAIKLDNALDNPLEARKDDEFSDEEIEYLSNKMKRFHFFHVLKERSTFDDAAFTFCDAYETSALSSHIVSQFNIKQLQVLSSILYGESQTTSLGESNNSVKNLKDLPQKSQPQKQELMVHVDSDKATSLKQEKEKKIFRKMKQNLVKLANCEYSDSEKTIFFLFDHFFALEAHSKASSKHKFGFLDSHGSKSKKGHNNHEERFVFGIFSIESMNLINKPSSNANPFCFGIQFRVNNRKNQEFVEFAKKNYNEIKKWYKSQEIIDEDSTMDTKKPTKKDNPSSSSSKSLIVKPNQEIVESQKRLCDAIEDLVFGFKSKYLQQFEKKENIVPNPQDFTTLTIYFNDERTLNGIFRVIQSNMFATFGKELKVGEFVQNQDTFQISNSVSPSKPKEIQKQQPASPKHARKLAYGVKPEISGRYYCNFNDKSGYLFVYRHGFGFKFINLETEEERPSNKKSLVSRFVRGSEEASELRRTFKPEDFAKLQEIMNKSPNNFDLHFFVPLGSIEKISKKRKNPSPKIDSIKIYIKPHVLPIAIESKTKNLKFIFTKLRSQEHFASCFEILKTSIEEHQQEQQENKVAVEEKQENMAMYSPKPKNFEKTSKQIQETQLEAEREQKIFVHEFGLPETEIILISLQGNYVNNSALAGNLFITNSYLCFLPKESPKILNSSSKEPSSSSSVRRARSSSLTNLVGKLWNAAGNVVTSTATSPSSASSAPIGDGKVCVNLKNVVKIGSDLKGCGIPHTTGGFFNKSPGKCLILDVKNSLASSGMEQFVFVNLIDPASGVEDAKIHTFLQALVSKANQKK